MSDHYCCKKCGQRYDVCQCGQQEALSNGVTDTFAMSKPEAVELNGDITRQQPNHFEALELAQVRGPNSNLARCYLDLVTRIRAVSPALVNVVAHASESRAILQVNARQVEWAGLLRVLHYDRDQK